MLKTGRPTASLQSIGNDRTAAINEQLTVSCISFGATQAPNLTLHVNDQRLENIYGGRVNMEEVRIQGNRQVIQGVALVGYIDTVSNGLFDYADNLLVECKAWYGDQMFKKKDLTLKKRDSGRRPPIQGPNRNPYPQNPRQGRGKYYYTCNMHTIISFILH